MAAGVPAQCVSLPAPMAISSYLSREKRLPFERRLSSSLHSSLPRDLPSVEQTPSTNTNTEHHSSILPYPAPIPAGFSALHTSCVVGTLVVSFTVRPQPLVHWVFPSTRHLGNGRALNLKLELPANKSQSTSRIKSPSLTLPSVAINPLSIHPSIHHDLLDPPRGRVCHCRPRFRSERNRRFHLLLRRPARYHQGRSEVELVSCAAEHLPRIVCQWPDERQHLRFGKFPSGVRCHPDFTRNGWEPIGTLA